MAASGRANYPLTDTFPALWCEGAPVHAIV